MTQLSYLYKANSVKRNLCIDLNTKKSQGTRKHILINKLSVEMYRRPLEVGLRLLDANQGERSNTFCPSFVIDVYYHTHIPGIDMSILGKIIILAL